jgi:hypothetical protein
MNGLRPARALFLALCLCVPAQLRAQVAQQAPSQAQAQRAAENFQVMMSALQSDKVPQPVKGLLFGCIYGNSFRQISESTDKVVSDKKLDRKNPTQVLSAMAAVCGFRPSAANPPKK